MSKCITVAIEINMADVGFLYLFHCRNKVGGRVLYDLYKRTVVPSDNGRARSFLLDFYYKDRYLLLIHKYYCKYVFLHTYLSYYILSVSFGSLLSAIVHLLPQINVRKDMRTALFYVVCALPVFIMNFI